MERDYGMGLMHVSWHADSSLQDYSTISVYVAEHPAARQNFGPGRIFPMRLFVSHPYTSLTRRLRYQNKGCRNDSNLKQLIGNRLPNFEAGPTVYKKIASNQKQRLATG